MAGHAAARGQDALGRVHAVNVFRRSLDPDEDHGFTSRRRALGGIGVEHHLARGRTRRGGKPLGQHIALGIGIERWVEQLVERRRIDPRDRLLAGDQALIRHVDRDLQRRLGGALARARLEHPELGLFDRELDVLHVAVMRLELVENGGELGIDLGHGLFHRGGLGVRFLARGLGQILRRADARDHVLALRVDQELAIIGAVALGRIAREGHARRRGVAHIAEDHRLYVDGGAPVGGNVVQATIDLGALRLPRPEHGTDRAPELVVHVLRKGLAPLLLDQTLIGGDQRLPILGRHLRIKGEAVILLGDLQRFLERAVIQLEDDIGIHLDEAAIAVPGKTLVARLLGQPLDGGVVEAEVQHRVHHARHRHPRARADRDQQRVFRVAEALFRHRLDMRDAVGHLVAQFLRKLLAILVIAGAHRGRDGEARRHRQPDRGHLGQVRALAPEQVLVPLAAVRNAAAEAVHIGHRFDPLLVVTSDALGTQASVYIRRYCRRGRQERIAPSPDPAQLIPRSSRSPPPCGRPPGHGRAARGARSA